jgi:hypothetical protein
MVECEHNAARREEGHKCAREGGRRKDGETKRKDVGRQYVKDDNKRLVRGVLRAGKGEAEMGERRIGRRRMEGARVTLHECERATRSPLG